jgi:hypothetical protein
MVANGFLALPGAITLTTLSTVTGTVSWECLYAPYDPGASVVAA